MVKRASQIRDIEEVRKNTLHGRVDEMIAGKTRIEMTDILKPQENGNPVALVFVEGPPGIGKSTLAWELCRRWDRKQYDLAVLLRLREIEVQQFKSVADLFPHVNQELQQHVTKDVVDREGKGVLFILDGFDELPIKLRRHSLFLKLIKGDVFPKSSVLVTSRPSATKDLHKACSPQIQRHVEILGFTQECITEYATSILSAEPEVLKDFLLYISPSVNPIINSLMYIPLNAAIIVHIYRNSMRKACPIPKTLTQVYTQLCLTLLQRYRESADPQDIDPLEKFSDLPHTHYNNFLKLAQLAFEQFEKHNVVFYSFEKLLHFGLLDSVPALYGGGGVSHSFLHLTLQEFLAAYHITQLSNGIDVFKCHSKDRRWEVVWRFASGLTGFQYFMDSVRCDVFVSSSEEDEYLKTKELLLHCLFEGQLKLDYMTVLGRNKICSQQVFSSPLDRYALGYCIANCSSSTSWKVCIKYGSDESFMWGLNSSDCGSGVISHLELYNFSRTCLDSYPSTILSGINHLHVRSSPIFVPTPDPSQYIDLLVQSIPLIRKNLTSLHIHVINASARLATLLDAISQTSVTTLTLHLVIDSYKYELYSPKFLSSLHGLINQPSSKLKDLTIRGVLGASAKPLCDVLFGPSSLNQLTLELSLAYFTENSFDLLATNTCLTTVHISGDDPPFETLFIILQKNKTIKNLCWGYYGKDLALLADLDVVLSSNATLKELTLVVSDYYEHHHLSSLVHDTRVQFNIQTFTEYSLQSFVVI